MLKIYEHTGEQGSLCALSLGCFTLLMKALQFLDTSSNCLYHTATSQPVGLQSQVMPLWDTQNVLQAAAFWVVILCNLGHMHAPDRSTVLTQVMGYSEMAVHSYQTMWWHVPDRSHCNYHTQVPYLIKTHFTHIPCTHRTHSELHGLSPRTNYTGRAVVSAMDPHDR
jgi:hypothetical protein